MKEVKNYIDAGAVANAIYPLDNATSPLKSMTDSQQGLANSNDEVFKPDPNPDSISDCIGHMIQFTQLLNSGDEQTVAEWRGMLCDIFFTGLISGRNSVIEYANDTTLCNIFFDRFEKNNETTGYEKLENNRHKVNSFMFYQKGKKAFAMIVPGIVIMPFANYDKTIFSASNWVNGSTRDWDINVINNYFKNYPDQGKMFIQYLVNLKAVCGGSAQIPLSNFINDVKRNMPDDYNIPQANVNTDAIVRDVLENGFAEQMYRLLGVDFYRGDFHEKNLLCFKPYDSTIERDTAVDTFENAWKSYRVDYDGKLLTPVKLYGFCNEDKKQAIYVVPPFNKSFLDAVESENVEFVEWSAELVEKSAEHSEIVISVEISLNGKRLAPLRHLYEERSILIAEDLPYITMWPFVKAANGAASWNEYFVGVLNRKWDHMGRPNFEHIDNALKKNVVEPMRRLPLKDIEIAVYGNGNTFKVDTQPFGTPDDKNREFTMLKTAFFPKYLTLSYKEPGEPVAKQIGCWQINEDLAVKLETKQGRNGIIGLDFATTSTVEALFVNNNAQFIDGPGSYLYDVFNPLWDSDANAGEKKDQWEMVQTYYLFGSKIGKCEKIYSYGQKNTAIKDNGIYNINTNYVTGRAVLVSPYYIQNAVSASNPHLDNSTIVTGIKWPKGQNVNDQRTAAENFILNCLTWGLLAARRQNCASVQINISYPLGNNNTIISTTMNAQMRYLREISGYTDNNLTWGSFSEAEANAKYLINGGMRLWHDIKEIPNPERGFMLADIGGGTTDIAVCQYDDMGIPFDQKLKSEISFGYAGRELVDVSLLKIKEFKELWKIKQDAGISQDKLKAILKAFDYNGPYQPENKKLPSFERVISFVGFLLDQATLSDEVAGLYIKNRMNDLKYKYLAFCWVLGRYIRQLNDEGVITVDTQNDFIVYLTGCAAKGIESFCMATDPDFITKCENAAVYGYFDNNSPEDAISFVNIRIFSGETKQEVSFGLTQLQGAANGQNIVPSGNRQMPALNGIPAPTVTADGAVKSNALKLDQQRTKECFRKIVDVVHSLEISHPTYESVMNEHQKEINEYITNLNHRVSIFDRLGVRDHYIVEELYALYAFEKYLDELC